MNNNRLYLGYTGNSFKIERVIFIFHVVRSTCTNNGQACCGETAKSARRSHFGQCLHDVIAWPSLTQIKGIRKRVAMTKATPIPSNKITKNKNTIIYQTSKQRNKNFAIIIFPECILIAVFHPVCKSSL